MKKSSAKNFLAERFLGVFKNSALDRDLFSVERFAFYLFGVCGLNFNITNIELGCRHCRPLPTEPPTTDLYCFCRRKVGFNERLPPRGSWRGTRLKEYACSIKFNNSMPRKTPSTANAVPLLSQEKANLTHSSVNSFIKNLLSA